MRAAAADASSTSDALATDIAQAVVALQFQDMVSQRLGHVVETLHDMGAALAGKHAAAPLVVAAADDHLTRMASRYTMAHERESQSRGLGLAPTGTEAPTGSVELF
jgi:hypothetical protein